MTESESVTGWLTRLKLGRSSAAGQLWRRYVEQLVRLARRKLANCDRGLADEEDVVLSVFNAFLNGVDDQRFLELDDRDDLWQILVMLTDRKAIALRRRGQAIKRGAGQVRVEPTRLDEVTAKEPTPAFALEMVEQLQRRLSGLQDPLLREIAVGKLQGYTQKELARQLNVSLRTVERKLSLIRRKWSDEVAR